MKRLDLAQRYGQGSWAFVTGAANGLGLEYCKHFAKLGFNLIMVDMDQELLNKTKADIQMEHKNCEILTTECDLTSLKNTEDIKTIFEEVFQKDISIFVGNAGIGSGVPFNQVPDTKVDTIINLH